MRWQRDTVLMASRRGCHRRIGDVIVSSPLVVHVYGPVLQVAASLSS
jgi:hypothetical protein